MASVFRNYGTFVCDATVTKQFADYLLDPEMNYYFHGSDLYPNVIIGLKKKYVLANNLWQPLPSDLEVFKGLVSAMQAKAGEMAQSHYGFIMKSPEGETLGVWYSLMDVRMIVKMGKGNQVDVFTDIKNIYD